MKPLVHSVPLGDWTCHILHDGAPGDWPRNVLFIETETQRFLVESGNGDVPPFGFIPDRLNALGLDCQDVDGVLLSHADWDHIGGTIGQNGAKIFPRARVLRECGADLVLVYHATFPGLGRLVPQDRGFAWTREPSERFTHPGWSGGG